MADTPLQFGSIVQLTDPQFDVSSIATDTLKAFHFDRTFGSPGSRWSAPFDPAHTTATPQFTARQKADFAKWNLLGKYKRFVPVAEVFASMSKMRGTKVGCVVVNEAKDVLSTGWNGAPRGSNADIDDRSLERESRLDWVVHAEANAIANAARRGTSLVGGTLVCTLMPCMTCAKLTVQAGITTVLCPEPGEANERWGRDFDLTRELFAECGVTLVHYDTPEGQE